ncbi:MAG: hypothetical protein Q8M71_02010 [Thermodesulfovibrionales bacterium]|nr:hypothetical protein [Thermodesulfovibrionales bacterium]
MNIEQAHNLSRSFLFAFQRCMEARQLPTGQFQLPVVPAVVCAALSVEIGFKAIILSEGNAASGHRIAELFKKISASMQDFIIKEVGLDRLAFTSSLDLVSNAFVEWRYIYEKDGANIDSDFLTKLANATQKATAIVKK